MIMQRLRLTVAMIIAVCTIEAVSDNTGVDYPSDYRSWQHVKSMIIQPGHPLEDPFGGIHHVYADPKAMSGLSTGEYPEGAVFVFDLFDYAEGDSTIVETERKRIDVMQYNGERFAETGGWGYETFVGNSTTERLVQDVVASCFNCHVAATESNYVFSRYRH